MEGGGGGEAEGRRSTRKEIRAIGRAMEEGGHGCETEETKGDEKNSEEDIWKKVKIVIWIRDEVEQGG